jgi:hypothetical protein
MQNHIKRYRVNGRYDDGESPDGEYVLYKDIAWMERELSYYRALTETLKEAIHLLNRTLRKAGVE